jgi:L,D-peptidoglycan transpeptidase YkuD (ErfK/YbiS/YcfS/YnhG family)
MRRLIALTALTALTVTGLLALSAPAAQAAASASAANQIVTVSVPTATSTTGVLELWVRQAGGGVVHAGGPFPVFVGELGVGATRDNVARTPAGVFGLTEAFGNQPNNGTRLPYFQAGPNDWWDGEDNSPTYGSHVRSATAPGPNSENLYAAGAVYAHAVVIDYNRFPAVPGMGSAFFLHVANGQPTAGCVSMASAQLDYVMRWLNPIAHPVISIGVGRAALTPILQANTIANLHNPTGHLDAVSIYPAYGWVRIRGWAMDPDNRSYPIAVEVRVNGRLVRHVLANKPRPDVVAALHTGPDQGFADVVYVGRGYLTICAVADNIGLGRANASLGCVSRFVA